MYTRVHIRAGWLTAGLLLALGYHSHAQTIPTDSVERRLRFLEQRFDTLRNQVQETAQEVRQQTRRSQESAQNIRFVIRGALPDTYLLIGGFVQADFIHSLRPLGNETRLRPSDIPVPNGHTPSTAFTPQFSRLFFRTIATTRGHHVFRTWLEFDVFNPDGPARPRLRHAWAEFGSLGAGQTWSLFIDPDAFPNVLEYNSSNSQLFARQMQVRYSPQPGRNLRGAVALEQPGSELRFAPGLTGYEVRAVYPDLTGMLRLGASQRRYLRLAGLLHPLSYRYQPIDELTTRLGWGLSLAGNLGVGPKDLLTFQANYGHGMSRYVNDLAGAGYDALLLTTGRLRPLPVLGGYAYYDHWWAEHWNSSVGWGYLQVQPIAGQEVLLPSSFHFSNYGIANLLYTPFSFFKIGIEYQYGAQQLLNSQTGSGSRLQLTVQSSF